MADDKISIKQIEMSIRRFDAAIEDYLKTLRKYRSNILRWLALNDWHLIKREEVNATRVIKQIKNVFIEMNELRQRARDEDLARFDALLEPGKRKAMDAINQYMQMELQVSRPLGFDDEDEYNVNPTQPRHGNAMAPQLAIQKLEVDFNADKYQLAQRQACLEEMEHLQCEISALNDMFSTTQSLVRVQAPIVEAIVEAAETAEEDVREGARQLRSAAIAKKAAYPVIGAFIGTCLAGPIGLLAGVKIGGIAAVGCGLLGYTGGSVLKSANPIMGSIDEQQEMSELPATGEKID